MKNGRFALSLLIMLSFVLFSANSQSHVFSFGNSLFSQEKSKSNSNGGGGNSDALIFSAACDQVVEGDFTAKLNTASGSVCNDFLSSDTITEVSLNYKITHGGNEDSNIQLVIFSPEDTTFSNGLRFGSFGASPEDQFSASTTFVSFSEITTFYGSQLQQRSATLQYPFGGPGTYRVCVTSNDAASNLNAELSIVGVVNFADTFYDCSLSFAPTSFPTGSVTNAPTNVDFMIDFSYRYSGGSGPEPGAIEGLRFVRVCDEPIDGYFLTKLDSYETVCGNFPTNNAVGDFKLTYEVIKPGTTGSNLQVAIFKPSDVDFQDGLRFGDVEDAVNDRFAATTKFIQYTDSRADDEYQLRSAEFVIEGYAEQGFFHVCIVNNNPFALDDSLIVKGRVEFKKVDYACAYDEPTEAPTSAPTKTPTKAPTFAPSAVPTVSPTNTPAPTTAKPSNAPSPAPGSPTLAPTRTPTFSPSRTPTAVPSAVPSAAPTFAPAPALIDVAVVVHTKTALTLSVTLQSAGSAYCSLYTTTRPTISSVISDNNFHDLSTSANFNYTGLIPATTYSVACVIYNTEENGGLQITQSAYNAQQVFKVATDCCKSISVTTVVKAIQAGQSMIGAISITLPFLPSTGTIVVSPFLKLNGNAVANSAKLFFPNSGAVFTPTGSKTIVLDFAGITTLGTYTVDITKSGTTAGDYEKVFVNDATFVVGSTFVPPPAPVILSAAFESDGSKFNIFFDSATSGLGAVSCCNYFTFTQCSTSKCTFSSDAKSVNVIPPANPTIAVGDSIVLIANKLIAKCSSNCGDYEFAAAATISLDAPDSPVEPIVVMSAPTKLGACLNWVLNLISSTGSGGRNWQAPVFTVTSNSPNRTDIQTLLNNDYTFSPPLPVPPSFLTPGFDYTVSVSLCNFLNKCGTASTTFTVVDAILPSVSILGRKTIVMNVDDPLKVSSNVFVGACDGSRSSKNLQYEWTLTILGTSTTVPITSSSKDPSILLLDPFTLTPGVSYSLTLVGTSLASGNSATDSIVVKVLQGAIVAQISGGLSRYITIGAGPITLDCSSSFDADTNSNAGLSFLWTCSTPFKTTCDVTMPNVLTTKSINVNIKGGVTPTAATKVTCTVFDATRSSAFDVSVLTLGAGAPTASISSLFPSLVNPFDKLTIAATASLPADSFVWWEVSDPSINLNTAALTTVNNTFDGITGKVVKSVNLVVKPNSLVPRSSLTFSLTAMNMFTFVSSVARVVVVTSGPPNPGTLTVTPSTGGQELVDTFSISADLWSADVLPITYEFGFISTTDGSFVVLQARSELAYTFSPLPRGVAANGDLLVVQVRVYDATDASADLSVSVPVSASVISDSDLQDMTNDRLSGAGDPDSIAKVVGTTSAYLNAVDCSGADSTFCAALNRNDCAKTTNTCGVCLDGFFGFEGDSNDGCIAVTRRRRLTAASCLNGCSSQGTCDFLNIDSHEPVSTCSTTDATCIAVCTCDAGFFGPDCSYTQTSLEGAQANRFALISALKDQVALQTPDATTVKAWIASLNGNTQKPEQLNKTALVLVNELLHTIADNLAVSGIAVDDAVDALVSIDRIAQVYAGLTNNLFEPNLSSGVAASRVSLLDKYTSYVSSTMVAGQSSISSIQSMFRVLSVVKALNNGGTVLTTLTEPLSALETADDIVANEIVVPIDNVVTSDVAELNMIVTRAIMYNRTATMNSNPVRLNARNLPCTFDGSDECAAVANLQNFRFVFVHTTEDLEFSGLNYTYDCPSGDHSVHELFCTDTFNESYTCNNPGSGFTRCPFFRNVSTCDAIAGLDAVTSNCSWVSNGHLNATCSCELAESAPTSSSYFTKDYVSVLGVQPQGFEQTFNADSSASSLGSGEIAGIVIGGLALLAIFVFAGMYILKALKERAIQREQYAVHKREVAEKKAASTAGRPTPLAAAEEDKAASSSYQYSPPPMPVTAQNPFAPHSPHKYVVRDGDVENKLSQFEDVDATENVLIVPEDVYDLGGGESSSSSAPPVVEPSSSCCGMKTKPKSVVETNPPPAPVEMATDAKSNPLAMALISSDSNEKDL